MLSRIVVYLCVRTIFLLPYVYVFVSQKKKNTCSYTWRLYKESQHNGMQPQEKQEKKKEKKKGETKAHIDWVPPRPAVGILRVTKLPLLEWQWGEFEHAQSEIDF